jgi:hypothetical protein
LIYCERATPKNLREKSRWHFFALPRAIDTNSTWYVVPQYVTAAEGILRGARTTTTTTTSNNNNNDNKQQASKAALVTAMTIFAMAINKKVNCGEFSTGHTPFYVFQALTVGCTSPSIVLFVLHLQK